MFVKETESGASTALSSSSQAGGMEIRNAARASDTASNEDGANGGLQPQPESGKQVAELLDKIKAKSESMRKPIIDRNGDHLDLMMSYRVKTEKETALRIYKDVMLTRNSQLAQQAVSHHIS